MIVSKLFRWNDVKISALLAGVLLAGVGSDSHGEETVLDTLQLHGFLSQALVITDHNDFFGPSSSDDGSFKYTEIGANASLRPHQNVLIAAQVLSRRAGSDGSDARPKLDYGIVDYQMLSNQHRTLGVQIGRVKNPFGFYNQTRDVAFTRPSILLPQSIYFDRTRSLALTGDGLALYMEERLPKGVLRGQLGVGEPQAGDDLRSTLRLDTTPGSLDPKNSLIGQLRYEHDGGRIVAAISAADANARFDSDTPAFSNGDFFFKPWVFSLQYNAEKWSLTGEYALRNSGLKEFDNPKVNFDVTGESWYLQYNRRFLDDWQWLIRYDSLISNRDDRSGKAYEASGAGPAHSQYAQDITLGLQWNLNPSVMLAAEYHHVDGTGWLPLQDNPDSSATRRRWNMLLFQLSLRF
ncbi:hypothetical protein [Halomonas korlensis]|uniref:Phosphate-selective porin O and P n=1 Tax=Halomonas korlensis TaxID=463301 RepID=A0A1I7I9S1_9GAMM|nr:hypothetical protein [Halomonas korlensis]SFU69681.1 hypothetical protein SAMN04487955_106146 [Halomonas korlensis]